MPYHTHSTFDCVSPDVKALRCQLCEQFRKYDTYNRGLITAASFSHALETLGLRFDPEDEQVKDILQFCTVTDDGYVYYKELLKHILPEEPKAKRETPYAIYPAPDDEATTNVQADSDQTSHEPSENNPIAQREYIAARAHDIQRLYSRWDRGVLTTDAFITGLEDLHIPLSAEFRRLLEVHGGTRDLGFAPLMASLQINDFMHRRARQTVVYSESDSLRASNNSRITTELGRKPAVRNPLTWELADSTQAPSKQVDPAENRNITQRVICDFCDGIVGAQVFVSQLEAVGIAITPIIQRLIRMHESGNCVHFREFASVIMRQGDTLFDHTPPPSCDKTRVTEAGELSYLPTPYATELTPEIPKLALPVSQQKHPNLPQFHKEEQRRPTGRQQVDRVQNQGDIIGWTGSQTMVQKPVTPLPCRGHGDIISWGGEADALKKNPKKYFAASHSTAAPFGTDSDVGRPLSAFSSSTDVYRQSHRA